MLKDKDLLVLNIKKVNQKVAKIKNILPSIDFRFLFDMYYNDIVSFINKKPREVNGIQMTKKEELLIINIKNLNKSVRKIKKTIPNPNYKCLFEMYFNDIVLLINKKQ